MNRGSSLSSFPGKPVRVRIMYYLSSPVQLIASPRSQLGASSKLCISAETVVIAAGTLDTFESHGVRMDRSLDPLSLQMRTPYVW